MKKLFQYEGAYLKLQDEEISLCKEQCKPRDMEKIGFMSGCQCKVEGEK